MAIGLLTDNKLLSLILQGFNPFQPDVGIFCGGYQGILYPNPTTLVAGDFNPYEFIDYMPTAYIPGGNYNGLGKGNPGIDYKNPGHILGLLDTFGRMSYGLRMLLDTHAGSNPSSFQPIINIDMPLSLADGSLAPVGLSDIYPLFTEIPSDWFNTFNVDPTGLITPTTHTPSTNIIGLQNFTDLFNKKTLSSYLDLIQYFRDTIQQLTTSASTLNNKVSMDFTLGDPTGPWSSQDEDAFENYSGYEFIHLDEVSSPPKSFQTEGTAYFQYDINQPSEALNMLTGSTEYHNGPNNVGDYRSITELNSVINIVPLQMVGATYLKETVLNHVYPPLQRQLLEDRSFISFSSYMLVDFIINISNPSSEPQTVTLEGDATVNNLVADPTRYWVENAWFTFVLTPTGFIQEPWLPPQVVTPFEWVQKNIDISVSSTNGFSWDKSWLKTSDFNTEEEFNDSSFIFKTQDNFAIKRNFPNPSNPRFADQTPLTLNFNKTFVLNPGCNSVRMRSRLNSNHMLFVPGRVKQDLWGTDLEVQHLFGVAEGVLSSIFLNPPGDIKDSLASPGLQLSFSVTGTNMNSKTYSVEI